MSTTVTMRKLRDYLNAIPEDQLDSQLYVYEGTYSDGLKPVINIASPVAAFPADKFVMLITHKDGSDLEKKLIPTVNYEIEEKK